MFRAILTMVVVCLMILVAAPTSAEYLYEEKCPLGDVPPGYREQFSGGNIAGGYWVPLNPKTQKGEFWADKWAFGQCECTSYVTHRINESLSVMHLTPNFNNNAFGQQWSNATNWKVVARGLGIPIFDYPCAGCVGYFPSSTSRPVGHVVFTESVIWKPNCFGGAECVEEVVLADYNRAGDHVFRRYTARPGDSRYPNEYIPLLDVIVACQEMFGSDLSACNTSRAVASLEAVGGFGGGESSGPAPLSGGVTSASLSDIIPYEVWMTNTPITLTDRSNASNSCRVGERRWMKGRTKNIGSKNAGNGIAVAFLCSNGSKIDDRPKTCGTDYVDKKNLKAGKTNTETESLVCGPYPGVYNYVFCVDTGRALAEKDEGNNCSREQVYTVTSNPDIVVTSVIPSKTVLMANESYAISSEVANWGDNFGRTIRIGYFLIDQAGMKTLIGYDRIKRENLQASWNKWETISVRAPSTPGSYSLQVCADIDNLIPEVNKANNCLTVAPIVVY